MCCTRRGTDLNFRSRYQIARQCPSVAPTFATRIVLQSSSRWTAKLYNSVTTKNSEKIKICVKLVGIEISAILFPMMNYHNKTFFLLSFRRFANPHRTRQTQKPSLSTRHATTHNESHSTWPKTETAHERFASTPTAFTICSTRDMPDKWCRPRTFSPIHKFISSSAHATTKWRTRSKAEPSWQTWSGSRRSDIAAMWTKSFATRLGKSPTSSWRSTKLTLWHRTRHRTWPMTATICTVRSRKKDISWRQRELKVSLIR